MSDQQRPLDPLALQHAQEMQGVEIPPERISAAHLAAVAAVLDRVFPLEDAGASSSEASGARFDVDVDLESFEVRREGLFVRLSLRDRAADDGGAL